MKKLLIKSSVVLCLALSMSVFASEDDNGPGNSIDGTIKRQATAADIKKNSKNENINLERILKTIKERNIGDIEEVVTDESQRFTSRRTTYSLNGFDVKTGDACQIKIIKALRDAKNIEIGYFDHIWSTEFETFITYPQFINDLIYSLEVESNSNRINGRFFSENIKSKKSGSVYLIDSDAVPQFVGNRTVGLIKLKKDSLIFKLKDLPSILPKSKHQTKREKKVISCEVTL